MIAKNEKFAWLRTRHSEYNEAMTVQKRRTIRHDGDLLFNRSLLNENINTNINPFAGFINFICSQSNVNENDCLLR